MVPPWPIPLSAGRNRSGHQVVTTVNRPQSVDERVTDPYILRFNPGRAALDIETGRVKLTDLASCGGCAAKYSAARLEQLLAGFDRSEERRVGKECRSRWS